MKHTQVLTQAYGLSTLSNLQKQVDMDARRTGANIMLNNSMTSWMACKARGASQSRGQSKNEEAFDPESYELAFVRLRSKDELSKSRSFCEKLRKSTVSMVRLNLDADLIYTLEEAFKAHVAAFDVDGENRISVEELIVILERCHLFDEFFTPSKVRNHFRAWADGCNHACMTKPLDDDGIGFAEFKFVLQWAADVKCVDMRQTVQKVVRLSRKLCDKEASVQRRLEVVFDTFSVQDPTRMSVFEFGNLCRKINVPVCMADIFLIFNSHNGGLKEGVDFEGFISVLTEVGKKLNMGEEVFATFAGAVEFLDNDETTLVRVKMKLLQAAGIVGGNDWERFFRECDIDGSGTLDWEGFLAICRERLHLADRDSHLRILFERLDVEACGEIAIDGMIDFIKQ